MSDDRTPTAADTPAPAEHVTPAWARAGAEAYTGTRWIDKERARLIKAIDHAEAEGRATGEDREA